MIGLTRNHRYFSQLCSSIEQRLCELGHLVPDQFPMTQREVIRGGDIVGIYFCMHGPRSVKLTAICDLEKRNVVFYGTDGLRRDCMSVPQWLTPDSCELPTRQLEFDR
jgi:hypothetical protein